MPHPQRLGIYGGTFDPIHYGHMAIAEEARWACGLDAVLVVPAAAQPFKRQRPTTAAHHRMAMVRLACADNPALRPSPIEIERPPPSYTIDTLAALRAELGPAVELTLILGSDAAADLPRWRAAAAIVGHARMAIVGRPGHQLDIAALTAALPALDGRATLIDGPRLAISSTDLRRRIAERRPIRYQTPPAVIDYLTAHGLYRAAGEEGS